MFVRAGMNWVEKAYAKAEKTYKEAQAAEERRREQSSTRRGSADASSGTRKDPPPSPGATPCSSATFKMGGPLGISWIQQRTDDAAVVKAIKPGSAASLVPGMCPGLLLTEVNGSPMAGVPYAEQIRAIREAVRPLRLGFDPSQVQEQTVTKGRRGSVERTAAGSPSMAEKWDAATQSGRKILQRLASDPGVRALQLVNRPPL